MFAYKVTRVLKEDARYSTWVDIIRAKGDLPDFNQLVDQAREFFAAEIVQEQQVLTVSGVRKASTLPSMPARNPVKCQYCGYRHHDRADCRFYKRDLEQGNLEPNGWYKENHHQRKLRQDSRKHQRFESKFAGALVTPDAFQAVTWGKQGFIIDSGSSFHMVNNASLLRNHQPISVEITTANNEELRCETKGEAVLVNHAGRQVLLRDVLFLPALTCNLLSVKKASEAGLNKNFTCDTVSFKLPGRQVLLTGKAAGSLYELSGHALTQGMAAPMMSPDRENNTTDVEPETPALPAAIGNANLKKLGLLWHRRLGHIGTTSRLKMIVNKRAIGLPHPTSPRWLPAGRAPRARRLATLSQPHPIAPAGL
jgi:hypothetical protein